MDLTEDDKEFGRFGNIDILPPSTVGCGYKKPQIAIVSGGKMKYKALPFSTMQTIVDSLRDECFFVQLGTEKDELLDGVYDFRGAEELRLSASVLYNSDLFVGTIGGLMHLARAVDCPAVIAYGAEPLELTYYTGNSYVFSETPCDFCANNKIDPYNQHCPNDYRCIRNIDPSKIVAAIRDKLAMSREFPRQTDICERKIPEALENWFIFKNLPSERYTH